MAHEEVDAAGRWKDIAITFLKLGATSYGGPAIMGIMQAELQDKRRWVSKERFVEGLSLVNMLPGATATQLGIFLAYARGGWWAGLIGGLCFILPAFAVMLALTIAYASVGALPVMRGALYGLGPVVLGIFVVAVYRLGQSAARTRTQVLIAVSAAVASAPSLLGVAAILTLAGGIGILVFHSRKLGALVVGALAVVLVVSSLGGLPGPATMAMAPGSAPQGLRGLGAYFFKVGAFTVGGGLTMLAFIQEQVVNDFHWLTPQQFLGGLALGQLTPGPVLMLAAYVGYSVAGVAGAAVAAGAAFLPSFILMLALLPLLDRLRGLTWTRAALRGMGPAVIGILAVSLIRLAPAAVPDLFALALLLATVLVLLVWRAGPLKLMLAGGIVGVVRTSWIPTSAWKAAMRAGSWVRG
jgi:chromate transporter